MSASGVFVPAVTIDGAQDVNGVKTFASGQKIDGAVATQRFLYFTTAKALRWAIALDSTAESGANAGSPLSIFAYSDAGGYISTPLTFARSTGQASFGVTPLVGSDPVATRGAAETFTGQKVFYGAFSTIFDRSDGVATKLVFRNASVNAGFVGCSAAKPMIWYDAPATSTLEWNGSTQFLIVGKAALVHAGAFTSAQVTLSTSAPSGGSDGDIWLQYV